MSAIADTDADSQSTASTSEHKIGATLAFRGIELTEKRVAFRLSQNPAGITLDDADVKALKAVLIPVQHARSIASIVVKRLESRQKARGYTVKADPTPGKP